MKFVTFLLFCVSVTGTCQNLNGKLTNDSILENRGKKTLVIFKESFLTCCVPWCHHSEITCTFYVHNVTDNRYLQLLIYEMINRVCKLLHSVNNPLKIKEHQTSGRRAKAKIEQIWTAGWDICMN